MVHFIGIKGSGMASLACILNDMGEVLKVVILKNLFLHKNH